MASEQGTIPSPYMGRKTEEIDEERYQTVYAGRASAVGGSTNCRLAFHLNCSSSEIKEFSTNPLHSM